MYKRYMDLLNSINEKDVEVDVNGVRLRGTLVGIEPTSLHLILKNVQEKSTTKDGMEWLYISPMMLINGTTVTRLWDITTEKQSK